MIAIMILYLPARTHLSIFGRSPSWSSGGFLILITIFLAFP